jgi:GH43 family beta-xylosidase
VGQSTFGDNLHVQGTISARTINLPADSVNNAAVIAAAGISASKVEQQHSVRHETADGTAVAASTNQVFIAYGATGTVVAFRVACTVAPTGADTVTVDLQKSTGGAAFATVLTGVVTLNVSSVARVVQSGTISATSFVAGDIFRIVVTASGTSCQGLIAQAVLRESPQ